MSLLNEDQVEQTYGISKPCQRRWRHLRKNLPFVKLGRLVRYRKEDLEAFIAANLQKPSGRPQAKEEVADEH